MPTRKTKNSSTNEAGTGGLRAAQGSVLDELKRPTTQSPFGPVTPRVVRTAVYRRASTDEVNQPYSLEMQESKCRDFARSQDMEIVADYSEYASGKDLEGRPELIRLLEDARDGKFDCVIVYKIDRWARRLLDTMSTIEFLLDNGVNLVSVTEPVSTTTPMGRLVLAMLAGFAEFERHLIIERVNRGIETKVKGGKPNGKVGYGLRKRADGIVEKNPDTWGVVTRIFDDYVHKNIGTKNIAMALQADGLPAPGKKPWNQMAVARILRNQMFVGKVLYRSVWLDGAHPPLLDEELFEAAQRRMDERASQTGAVQTRSDYLLSGIVTCGLCGGAYVANKGRSKTGESFRYYTCNTRRRDKTCTAPTVSAEDLEKVVTDALISLYGDTSLFAEAVETFVAGQANSSGPLHDELTAIRAVIADKERVRARYQADYEAGTLPADLYVAPARSLDTEITAAKLRQADIEVELAQLDTAHAPSDADRASLCEILLAGIHTGPIKARKELFKALVAKLEVYDVDDIRPTFRIGGPDLLGPAPRDVLDRLSTETADMLDGLAMRMADDGLEVVLAGDDAAGAQAPESGKLANTSVFASHHVGWS